MKTKRQNHHRGWKQALSVLLVFALAAGLVLSVPALSGIAYAAPTLWGEGDGNVSPVEAPEDPSDAGAPGMDPCTVKVGLPTTMTGEDTMDLDKAKTFADLYLIAPAVRLSGYDVYAFCVDSSMPYYAWVEHYVTTTKGWRAQEYNTAPEDYPEKGPGDYKWLVFRYAPEDPESVSVDAHNDLAELLAMACFAPELLPELEGAAKPEALAEAGPTAHTTIDTKSANVSAGLYLNVVHGEFAQWEDYTVLVHEDGAPENDPGKVCTIAYSDTKVYTFQPQLISLPGRIDTNGMETADTTQPGAWVYDMNITAKGEAAERYADLEITKDLTAFRNPVSFVFYVAAYTPEDKELTNPIFKKVVPLTFTGAGQQTVLVSTGEIPVNSTVVITEEYGGAGYKFNSANVTVRNVGAAENTAVSFEEGVTVNVANRSITITQIPAGTIHLTAPSGEEKTLADGKTENAVFTNDHDNTNNGGGAVVNSFEQDAQNGWQWTRRRYDAEKKAWVDDDQVSVPVTND